MTACLSCPHCEELFDDEDEWFEHVCECIEQRLDRVKIDAALAEVAKEKDDEESEAN